MLVSSMDVAFATGLWKLQMWPYVLYVRTRITELPESSSIVQDRSEYETRRDWDN